MFVLSYEAFGKLQRSSLTFVLWFMIVQLICMPFEVFVMLIVYKYHLL